MQKKLILLVLSIFSVMSTGCQNDNDTLLYSKDDITKEDQAIIDYIVNEFGISEFDIEVLPDHIAVQGDMVFPKENFWRDYAKPVEGKE